MAEKFQKTDDLRIKEIKEVLSPEQIRREFPVSEKAALTTLETRRAIHRILHGADDRLLVIVGPCSIHDPKAALEYARKLKTEKDRHEAELLIVMRVYFEKPRTTVGWKGLINDPKLYDRLNSTVGEVQQMVDEISSGKGSVGKLIASDEIYNKANAAVDKLTGIIDEINNGNGTVGKLIKDPAL